MSKFINNQAVTSNLYQKTRIYKDVTHLSYYFQKNGKVTKKFKPVDIDGCRYRQNLETNDIFHQVKSIKKRILSQDQ